MSREGLAARLLATFLEELDEQVRIMNAELLALESDPGRPEPLRALFRAAHTLKGAGHAAGVPLVEEVCHHAESLLAAARDGRAALGPTEVRLLFSAADGLAAAGERLRAGADLQDSQLSELSRSLRAHRERPAQTAIHRTPPTPAPAPERPTPATPATPATPTTSPEPAPPARRPGASAPVRVEGEKLDALLRVASEVATAAGRWESRGVELETMREVVSRAEALCARLTRRLGEPPVELVRLEENLTRLAALTTRTSEDATRDARALGRVSDELSHQVHRLRLRPFAEICEGLPRLVRDLATGVGKEVRLEILGRDVQAERAVWTAVREAMMHLVRNAVDHGIETPEERLARGKPRSGTVVVGAELRGERVVVTITDDGAGLDLAALRARLAERDLTAPDDDAELARLLFRGGLSSRKQATAVSGRGVGLDSARAALEHIQGSISVSWRPGRGTTFRLECPPSLTTVRSLLVTAGEHTLAVPTACVERVVRLRPEELASLDGRTVVPDAAGPVPLVELTRLFGDDPPRRDAEARVTVLRLRSDERRMAVVVDSCLAEREILVRPLRGVRSPPPYLSGAALLPDERIALVLNPVALLEEGLRVGADTGLRLERASEQRRPRLLVVDDSITTRTLEQSILQAAGFEVVTAVDGADGWRRLNETPCDLVVSDVEMPRMDGFALCRAIRASDRLRHTPVILVTALETPEHRAEGLEAGADAYLTKSSFDQDQLLETIRQLVGAP